MQKKETPVLAEASQPLPVHHVPRLKPGCRPDLAWDGDAWKNAQSIQIGAFLPGSRHEPRTDAKIQYDSSKVHVLFRVEDRFVLSRNTRYQDMVCNDSCVEFFVRPLDSKGYFNLEVNCGGALLCYYIEDWKIVSGGFAKFTKLPFELGGQISVETTMPQKVDPEISIPTTWLAQITLPFKVMEAYTGPLAPGKGGAWRANFYKCANLCSHPHWGAWSPPPVKNFHLPDFFGTLVFD